MVNSRMSRSQVRRNARKLRRYGVEPMAMIGDDLGLGPVAAVVIARWLYRYRSELVPVVIATATWLAAWALHAWHPRSWPIVVALAAMAALGLGLAGRYVGLAHGSERLYVAAVIVAVGGWLAAATALGPMSRSLMQVLLVGGLVLAVPWWAHRRRRARVRVERKLEAWPQIAQAVGLSGSQVMSAVVDLWGWRARFRLARGQTIDDVRAKLPAIESGLGTYRGAVRAYPTPDDLANRFELRVLDKDPHADAIAWPGPGVTSITEPIDLGPFEDATSAKVLLLRRHGLFGGVSGSGKSGGLNVVMGNLTACRDVVIWAIDLKRGMELGPWAPCIARLATTPAQARALLADAVAILEARAAYLAATGQRVWEPSPEMPALLIIVDEYAELVETAPEATSDADSIARRGRAVAVTLLAATQRPTQKAMGQGALRSQMDVRICFRVRERKDVDLILGQGMLAAGWHAHTLNAPGKFLISAPEHDTPRRARAYLVTDDAVSTAVGDHAPGRPALDEVSRHAAEERAQIDPDAPAQTPSRGHGDDIGNVPGDTRGDPEVMLWAALCLAPAEGVTVPELMGETGMSRPWVYQRLQDLARRGHVTPVSRGRWKAGNHAR
jgi:hypothetical protein